MTIFQSVAAGLPILTTRIRAAADYLREPDNLLWVKPSNPEGLAERAAWLLDRPEVMAAMSRNNHALASAFGADAVAREYLSVYRFLSAGPARSAPLPRLAPGASATRGATVAPPASERTR